MTQPSPFDELAARLRAAPRDRAQLALAEERVAAGEGAALFAALFATMERDVAATMRLLEAMFDDSPPVAGYLMVRLLPAAEHQKMHHTCDAIALWMTAARDPALADALMRLAGEGVRTRLVRQLHAWALAIRTREPHP